MIRKSDEFTPRTNLRGGEGTVEMHVLLTPEECAGKVTMCNRVVLPPHTSIGYHQHVDNVEYYCPLKGKGVFIDENGERNDVVEGDVCLIKRGQSHGMANETDEPFEMLAIIIE